MADLFLFRVSGTGHTTPPPGSYESLQYINIHIWKKQYVITEKYSSIPARTAQYGLKASV